MSDKKVFHWIARGLFALVIPSAVIVTAVTFLSDWQHQGFGGLAFLATWAATTSGIAGAAVLAALAEYVAYRRGEIPRINKIVLLLPLGLALVTGASVPSVIAITKLKERQAHVELTQRAESGDLGAQVEAGQRLVARDRTAEDQRQGMRLLEHAASAGSDMARYQLALLLHHGRDGVIEADAKRALAYLKNVSDSEDQLVAELTRTAFQQLEFVAQMKAAAMRGDPRKMCELGTILHRELDWTLRKDLRQAVRWQREAIARGDDRCRDSLTSAWQDYRGLWAKATTGKSQAEMRAIVGEPDRVHNGSANYLQDSNQESISTITIWRQIRTLYADFTPTYRYEMWVYDLGDGARAIAVFHGVHGDRAEAQQLVLDVLHADDG